MDAPFRVPATEIENRIDGFQARLSERGLEAALIVQRVDLFYFTGTAQNGLLYVPAKGTPMLGIRRQLERAREETPLEQVVALSRVREMPQRIRQGYGRLPLRLGLELDVLPVRDYRFLREIFEMPQVEDISDWILQQRAVKSAWEIKQMQNTAARSRHTFDYLQQILEPGLTEMEFAAMGEAHARKYGHAGRLRSRHFQSEVYPWHVLSGPNSGKPGLLDSPFSGAGTSAAFPCGAGNRRMRAGEPILVDFGWVHNGYHVDETRMFAIGDLPEPVQKAYQATVTVHDALLEAARPGMKSGALFELAVTVADRLGYSNFFPGTAAGKVRFVGHGIGLELVEPPLIAAHRSDPLLPGTVFALEPKLCFEGHFGVGIESVFQMTKTDCQLLSRVPVKLFQVPSTG
ncbi:MAG TPA: M24 family metallopeptidase [Desulfobacterales bacterium]